jgi:hypothetical protein
VDIADEAAPRPTTPWRTSIALLVVILAGIGSFHAALQTTTWWLSALIFVVVALGAAAGVRAVTRLRGLPVVAGIVAGAILLGLFFAPSTTFLGVPTGDTLDAWAGLSSEGALSIARQSVPARVDDGILFLICLGSVVLAVIADAVAISWRSPALVGIMMVPLVFAPALFRIGEVDLFWVVSAAVAFLWLLAAGHRPGRKGWDSVAIGSTALVVALIAPVLMPSPSGLASPGGGGGSIAAGIDPLVTLGQNLRREGTLPALTYTTVSGRQHYLRLTSFGHVVGGGWEPGLADPADGAEGPPVPGLDDAVQRTAEQTVITLAELGGRWLPVPYPAVAVEGLRNPALWDETTLALQSTSRSVRGESYTVNSLELMPTEEQLRAAGSNVPDDVAEFAITGEEWPSIIAETARAVTEDAATNYDRAEALQRYLRSAAFEYSETAPVDEGYDGTGSGVIGIFLEVRSGYCIHYASAMALMARTLGIPARLAVGFLPGAETREADDESDEDAAASTEFTVTSRELHAWPELYFDGIGWVAFEPTSSRGAQPDFPSAADALIDSSAAVPAAPVGPAPSASADPLADAGFSDAGSAGEGPGQGEADGAPWGLLALLVAVFALVPGVVRLGQRWARLSGLGRPGVGPAAAWREVMQTAFDLGFAVAPTETPRGNARLLRAALGDGGAGVLDTIVDSVERTSFSRAGLPRTGSGSSPSQLGVRRILRGLRRSSGWRRRILATAWPKSVIERMLRIVT